MILARAIILIVCCFLTHVISLQYDLRTRNSLLHRRQQEQKIQYNKARLRARNVPTSEDSITHNYKLHELYYNGVPDTYDLQGNKITGVAPDAKKAIHYLRLVCEDTKATNAPAMWLKLASIYQNGMYNFDPNLEYSKILYQEIIHRFPYHADTDAARDSLTDVITEINNIHTYGWLNLQYTPKKNAHHDKIKAMLTRAQNRGRGGGGDAGIVTIAANDLFRAGAPAVFGVPTQHAGATVPVNVNAVGHNDNHNTHNSQVVGTVAHSLGKLKKGTTITTCLSDSLKQIRTFLSGKPHCDKTLDAYKSLDSIERNIIPITSVGMKETEAMNILWNRINDTRHTEKQSDIKDIFYNQLADMQEHGKSVCATGRLSRMVDTLNTFDEDVSIKPTYVINQEMMTKAGKLREDLYVGLPKDRVNMLSAGTAPDQDDFDAKARESIVSSLTKEYVDTGIITENAFTKSVEGWIDEL